MFSSRISTVTRRGFLRRAGLGAMACLSPCIFAEELLRTPRQTEGPFYPDKLPLDTDNDLLVINDSLTPAVGEITYLSGRILDARGQPLRGAQVEIWQVDSRGIYLHSDGGDRVRRDANFQGYGRFLTGSSGEYLFRTIKPVSYPGRAPHIHFAVQVRNAEKFITQCYVKGDPRNEHDSILRAVRDARARALLIVDFAPIPDSRIGELAARFDIWLGLTPAG